jgi:hypothetical protein
VRTRVLASITLWLVAVTSIAAIAWLAIDAAGRQVTSSPIAASVITTGPATKRPTATPTGRPTTTAARPSTRPAAKITTAPADGTTNAEPSGTPEHPKHHLGTTPAAVAGTYSTVGGRVRVVCRGPAITLDGGYAQPASGWSIRVATGGPLQVQVVFELDDDQALLVSALCIDGKPQFDQHRIEAGSPPQGPTSR